MAKKKDIMGPTKKKKVDPWSRHMAVVRKKMRDLGAADRYIKNG